MDDVVEATQAIFIISIGITVASFLLNTSRVLNAIEVLKECLILLNNRALEKEKEFVTSVYINVYFQIFNGYCLINDCTNAIECGKKFLVILQECGEKSIERKVTFELANFSMRQFKYKKALRIMMEVDERQGEGGVLCKHRICVSSSPGIWQG